MLVINLAGLALIALIGWWFWLYEPKEAVADEKDLVVTVENGIYTPARIKFMRKD